MYNYGEFGTMLHLQDSDLQGRILSIRLLSIDPISRQSCDVQEAVLEYDDRFVVASHNRNGEFGAIALTSNEKHRFHGVGPRVFLTESDHVAYHHGTYENSELDCLTFSWNDTWLHIFRGEYDLAFTRSSIDLTTDFSCPTAEQEPTIAFAI